jgi:peroxiredoxin
MDRRENREFIFLRTTYTDKTKAIIWLFILIFGAAFVIAYLNSSVSYETIPIGVQVPPVNMDSGTGERIALADMHGSVVLLVYFTVECGNCKYTIENLNALYAEFSDSLAIVGVSGSDSERTHQFGLRYNIKFPVLIDDNSNVRKLFKIPSVPAMYLIDRDMNLHAYRFGRRSMGKDREWLSNELMKIAGWQSLE